MYIYIHIPFCSHICSYCDFPKVLYDKKYIKSYLKKLEYEIKTRYRNEEVISIFIGGGTPTSLDLEELEYLLSLTKIFHQSKGMEFTIESNIDGLTYEKIKLLRKYGINRVSLGVQSFQEEVLSELNRYHNSAMVKEVIGLLKQEGIYNISMDYIYGVNDDINALREDIYCFLSLDIPHISCYSLIIEDGTFLKISGKKYVQRLPRIQSSLNSRKMYAESSKILMK